MSKFKKFAGNSTGIRNRLFTETIAITLIFTLLVLCFNSSFTEKIFINRTKKEMCSIAEKIKTYDLLSTSYYKDISELESLTNAYIEIYSLVTETIIYATKNNDYLYGGQLNTSDTKEKLLRTIKMPELNSDGSFFDTKQEIKGTAKYIVYNSVIGDFFAVRIYESLDVVESTSKLARDFINIFCAALFIVITSLLIVYENLYTKPILTVNNVAKKMAQLDFTQRCPKSKIREINELGKSLNQLSSALDMSLVDLREKNKQLEMDIYKEQQIDKAKNEFISNASHELKTPISIIQGYAEGLKIGITDGEDAEEYCDIIMEEAQKMNALVINLLEICQYESGVHKFKKENFNILYVTESLLRPRIKLLKDDGITLCININAGYEGCADVSSIDTIINNYVSNAVSHASGKKLILICCKDIGDKFRFSVYNSGQNISDEDIDRIWDSFYRADKAHSRAEGRFGLGLSFVKSIQELHKNGYGVINRPDGVEFWIDIDKAKPEDEDED